jgi:iron complex transport system substrate-binding protein
MRKVFCETLGTTLHLPDKIERIVSFSPAVTETLFLLGAGDEIAGVSAFCARPPEARRKKVLGSYNTVSMDTLKEIGPDVLFTTTGYQREFAARLAKNFPVYALELPVSVSGIVDFAQKVGLVIGRILEGAALSRRLIESLARCSQAKTRVRAYLEIDFNGPVSFGAYSYITDALRYLGVESIYGNQFCEWLTPDLDFVRGSDPDVIFYEAKMYSRFKNEDLERLLVTRGWENMRAVREDCAFLAPGPLDFFAHHGPSFITEVLPWIGGRLENK